MIKRIDNAIKQALEPIGMPVFFAKRKGHCIVVTYYAVPGTAADDCQDTMIFKILLNIFVDSGTIKETGVQVMKALRKGGFSAVSMEMPVEENDGTYNVAITCRMSTEC